MRTGPTNCPRPFRGQRDLNRRRPHCKCWHRRFFDELLARLLIRVFDAKDVSELQENRAHERDARHTNPDAVEGWAFDPKTFEALLERMATYRKVVILSAIVHYAASHVMSYWKKGDAKPAQIVQLTSSGLQTS